MTSPIPKPTLTPISALVTLGNTHTQIDNRTVATLRRREYDFSMAIAKRATPKKRIEAMMTWQCPTCERELRDDWQYCPYCGQKLEYEKENKNGSCD